MPNTKITGQKWKDHLSYAKKIYIIGAILAIAVSSLIFSVTRYTPPNERSVLIELVDNYTDPSKLDADLPALLAAGQAYDETLEQVAFYSIAYSGAGDTGDMYGSQVYMVQIYAGDNDIYLQDEILTNQLIDQGYCLPLELIEGFEAFTQKFPEVEVLWLPEVDPEADEEDEDAEPDEDAPEKPMHAYAIDISTLTGMAERGAFAVNGKYAVLAFASKNAETSFHVLTQMFDVFAPQKTATPSEAAE